MRTIFCALNVLTPSHPAMLPLLFMNETLSIIPPTTLQRVNHPSVPPARPVIRCPSARVEEFARPDRQRTVQQSGEQTCCHDAITEKIQTRCGIRLEIAGSMTVTSRVARNLQ